MSGPLPALRWKPAGLPWGHSNLCSGGGIRVCSRLSRTPGPVVLLPPKGLTLLQSLLRRHSRLKSPWMPDFPGALCKEAQLLPDPAPPGCIFFQKNKQMDAEPNAAHCPQDQKAWPAGPGCSSGGGWEKLLVASSDEASQRGTSSRFGRHRHGPPLREPTV